MKKIGFIGTGNMGGALASSVCTAIPSKNVFLSDFDTKKAEALAEKLSANPSDNCEIAKGCNYIFLGVKPQVLSKTIDEIKDVVAERNDDFTIISMAAGVGTSTIEEYFGKKIPIIRIMPNIPVQCGCGVILCTSNDAVTEDNFGCFTDMMKNAGYIDKIDEKLIDAASAVSGCGPAFVYMFIEALADGAVRCGLPRDKALRYAGETVSGAARHLCESDRNPGEMKDAVCSPAGSTIEGVYALERGSFRCDVINAVTESYKRTKELGKK